MPECRAEAITSSLSSFFLEAEEQSSILGQHPVHLVSFGSCFKRQSDFYPSSSQEQAVLLQDRITKNVLQKQLQSTALQPFFSCAFLQSAAAFSGTIEKTTFCYLLVICRANCLCSGCSYSLKEVESRRLEHRNKTKC